MTSQVLFDKLAYIDRLTRAGIADEQARAHAEAMDEALRESVATQSDIAVLRSDIAVLRTELKNDVALAVRDMTIRTGAMLIVLFGALTSIKFWG